MTAVARQGWRSVRMPWRRPWAWSLPTAHGPPVAVLPSPVRPLDALLGLLMAVHEATDGMGPGGGDPVAPIDHSVPNLSMEELVAEHSDAVYRVALSVTRNPSLAEDVAQDSLIKAWQALPSFRGEAPLRNWILRITHNTAVSALRRRREDLRDPVDLPETSTGPTIETQVQNRIALERFVVALDELNPVSRSIVVLREVEGLTYEEICDVLSLPLPTVKTRLLRARRQLATSLEGWQP